MSVVRGIDYYGVLGITKNADNLDVKNAYRHLALQYNAERQKDPAVARLFVLAGEAYEILNNDLLRAIYDQYGEVGLKKGILTPAGWHSPYVYHGDPLRTYKEFFGTSSPYADLIEVVRKTSNMVLLPDGAGFKTKQPPIIKPLYVSLEEIYNGALKKVKIKHTAFRDENKDTTKVEEKILRIEVKPGLPEGTEIIFPESGDEGPTTTPGDYIYVLKDKHHPEYKRIGVDLIMNKNVSLNEALNGLVIPFTTLDGRKLKTRITQVIRPDYKKVVHGEGMPNVLNPTKFGDLIIEFSIGFPNYVPQACKRLIVRGLSEAEQVEHSLFLFSPDKENADRKAQISLCKLKSEKLH